MNFKVSNIILSAVILSSTTVNAWADNPKVDVFSANKPSSSNAYVSNFNYKNTPNSVGMPKTSETLWFEKYDNLVETLTPNQSDKVIMSRPFNQEAERVEQWVATAKKIIKNYHKLAAELKQMPLPNNSPELKDFISLTSDWYSDSAGVFEDLIKPRPAARTIEELQEALNEIKQRSDDLAKTKKSLMAMDYKIRKTFNVHLAKQDDALMQYVSRK